MTSVMYNSYNNDRMVDSSEDFQHHQRLDTNNGNSSIPRWKIPLSRSYSSTFYNDRKIFSPVVEEDISGRKSKDFNEETKDQLENSKELTQERTFSGGDEDEEPDPDAVIQILLPCIICNRTFSPEALERHAKICTRVNLTEKKPHRPVYDSHAMRIKNTKVADFIPPPDPREPNPLSRSSSFRRSFQSRSSFNNRGRSNSSTTGSIVDVPPVVPRRTRATSTPKTLNLYHHNDSGQDTFGGGGGSSSEYGSSEGSTTENQHHEGIPSYARALSPAEDCPYCLRSFGIKAYDRHVAFCREIWERRQYETQPTPKEVEEARERQELRVKYRPIKGSSSLQSLRSMSPGKDTVHNFATLALNKLFGKSSNYNFKKSNDSLSASCYGDFTRSSSFRHPTPQRTSSKIPTTSTSSASAMKLNTSSNLPSLHRSTSKTKSNERLENVPSSGYGPGGHYMSNFSRNSKIRSSLGRNFFRTNKHVEPEGHESTANETMSPLIITPMNFYSKGSSNPSFTSMHPQHQSNMRTNYLKPESVSMSKSTLLSGDQKYDPYEKAAKQLEELLKCQPQQSLAASNRSKDTQRKIGFDRVLASVGMGGGSASGSSSNRPSFSSPSSKSLPHPGYNHNNYTQEQEHYSYIRDEDPFREISADESYWEEILRAKREENDKLNLYASSCAPTAILPTNPSTSYDHSMVSSDQIQQDKRDSSDCSSTENYKHRGISNVSSADSAFSRSDGTDVEFEALENLLSLGELPALTQSSMNPSSSGGGGSSSITKQRVRSNSHILPIRHESNPTELHKESSSNPTNIHLKNTIDSSEMKPTQLAPSYAKFCHECGTPYPTTVAKFCSECGEKRVLNV